jgi:hypothetical protein
MDTGDTGRVLATYRYVGDRNVGTDLSRDLWDDLRPVRSDSAEKRYQ